MQAFQKDMFSNMFDQCKVYDKMGVLKMWTDGMKSLEKYNLFGNFHNIAENDKVSKSFETMNNLFSAGMKNLEAFSEASQKVFENSQGALKTRMSLYQESYSDFMQLVKELMATKNVEHATSKHTDYVKKTVASLVGDFKNLSNSLSDSNSKVFENLNRKLNENIAKHSREFKTTAAASKKAS